VHAARAERPGPQGAPLAVGHDSGLLGIHLLLAGDECLPAGPAGAGAAELDLGPVDAELGSAGGGVGEDVGEGAEPQARAVQDGETRGPRAGGGSHGRCG